MKQGVLLFLMMAMLTLTLTTTASAAPSVIFNTLGSATPSTISALGGSGGKVFGSYFNIDAGATGTITSVTVPLRGTTGGSSLTYVAGLFSSTTSSTVPTTFVADLRTASTSSATLTNVTFTPASAIALASGTRYWVLVANTTTGTGAFYRADDPVNTAGYSNITTSAGLDSITQSTTLNLTTLNGVFLNGVVTANSMLFSVTGTVMLNQTITFVHAGPDNFGTTPTLTATTTATGLTPTFSSTTTDVCTITTPSPGVLTFLKAGTCTIKADQAGNSTYNPAVTVTQSFTVNKITPSVTAWPTASGISYGQTLADSVLNGGTATVPGSFAFTTPSTAPGVGTASQSVTFTPTQSGGYNTVVGSASVTVSKATPTVSVWPTASTITYGQTLASSSLTGGTASVAGTFAFTTPSTAPGAGTALQGVTFTPTVTANYNTVTGSVNVTVNKATPIVASWPTASTITYGQTLAASTLTGGSADVAGTFTFTTPTTVPGGGTASQSVTFTPTASANYNTVPGSVNVTVNKATPTVNSWPTASAIICGQTLANSILTGGSATVAGTFTFTTPSTTPGHGTAAQDVTFTPDVPANYNTVSGTVNVTVNYSPAKPTLDISTLADGSVTKVTTLNISGSASSVNGIKSVTINGVGQTLVGVSNSFSTAYTLVPGANVLTTVATDNADQTITDIRTITLDQTAPGLTVTTPTDGSAVGSALLTVTGTIDDATALVDVTLNGGAPLAATKDGLNYSRALTLINGVNTIQVTATDPALNSSSISRTVTYDHTAPGVAITYPPADFTTNDPALAFTLTGTVTDDLTAVTVSITCDGVTYTPAVTAGAFSQALTLTSTIAKSYAIVVTATDAAGNHAAATRNINYQPKIVITTTPAGRTILVDGNVLISPQNYSWPTGEKHTIAVAATQPGVTGIRYNFTNWSDAGAASHEITAPATAATYTAELATQYQITTAASPVGSASISLSVGGLSQPTNWFNAGTAVSIKAFPVTPRIFSVWSGGAAGSVNPVVTLPLTGPLNVVATTTLPAAVAVLTPPAGITRSGAYDTRSWGFTLTNNSTVAANDVKITGLTITPSAACVPAISVTGLPATVGTGTIAVGSSAIGTVQINLSGCASTTKLSATFSYSFTGSSTFTKTFNNQVR